MRKKFLFFLQHIEWPLLLACVLCSCFGLWLISMASSGVNRERYLLVQAAAAAMGVIGFIIMGFMDKNRFFSGWKLTLALEIALIALLIPFGTGLEQTGNQSWIRFSVFGVSTGFQPGEISKALYILALASHASRLDLSRLRDLLPFALHGAIVPVFLLAVSKDYGTVLSLGAIFVIMALLGGVKLRYFASVAAATTLFFPYIWNSLLLDRQRERLTVILDPSSDPLGVGYQTIKSVNAIAAGGLLGSPVERLGSLPARHTDFIFAVAGERLGFAGGMAIIFLMMGFVLRALWGFAKADSGRGKMICAGVAAAFIFHVFANIGMCLGISPVIGITLPFLSYGGTSIIVFYFFAGLLAMHRKQIGNNLIIQQTEVIK